MIIIKKNQIIFDISKNVSISGSLKVANLIGESKINVLDGHKLKLQLDVICKKSPPNGTCEQV